MFPNALQEIEKVNLRKIFHHPKGRHNSGFLSPDYQLPLVTRILVSGWLPLTTGYQNFGPRVVTDYHCLPEFQAQSGSRLPLITIISVSD